MGCDLEQQGIQYDLINEEAQNNINEIKDTISEKDSQTDNNKEENIVLMETKVQENDNKNIQLKLRQNHIQFIKGSCCGHGAFGQVYRGISIQNGQPIAIKELTIKPQESNQAESEAYFMAKLNHQNIIKIYDYEKHDNQYTITMESLQQSLCQLCREFNGLPLGFIKKYSYQILNALNYMHSNKICHLDLKSGNIMMTAGMDCKIIDFGTSQIQENELSWVNGVKGTVYYLAPETVKQEYYDGFKADIYSFGCMLIEMVDGVPPLYQIKSAPAVLYEISKLKQPLKPINKCNHQLYEIIKQCVDLKPDKRPSCKQLLENDFFKITEIPEIQTLPLKNQQIEKQFIEQSNEQSVSMSIFNVQKNKKNIVVHIQKQLNQRKKKNIWTIQPPEKDLCKKQNYRVQQKYFNF